MSWIVDSSITHFQKFCVNVLKCGPIPKHIAFIMDGNRRYAKKTKVEKSEGHSKGFDKLAETLQWCRELEINEVTVYAFSIENFKRSQDEVDTLMKLATEKFRKLLEEKEKIMAEGICIRVMGNMSLLSPELRKLVAEVTVMTRDNKRAFLNVCFAYTSRDEIVSTANTIVGAVQEDLIQVDDIDDDLVSNCLYTGAGPDVDVLVRTSGEVRLSDFLLWQVSKSNSQICFTEVLWPEFRIWHLLGCVFKYQRSYDEAKKIDRQKQGKNERVKTFLEELHHRRLTELQSYLS